MIRRALLRIPLIARIRLWWNSIWADLDNWENQDVWFDD